MQTIPNSDDARPLIKNGAFQIGLRSTRYDHSQFLEAQLHKPKRTSYGPALLRFLPVVSVAAILWLVAAPQKATLNLAVAAASYAGALHESTLVADFRAAAGSAASGMSCWPMNDSIGPLGTEFTNGCNTVNPLTFPYAQTGGIQSGQTTPIVVTASDAVSTLFAGQQSRLTSTTTLASASDWTISAAYNMTGAVKADTGLLDTGNPKLGSGVELYVDRLGRTSIYLGGDSPLSVSNADRSGAHSHVVFATWQHASATSGALTLYDRDETTGLTTTASRHVAYFSAGRTPLGAIVPTSGYAAFAGNIAWLSYTPTAMSSSTVESLIADMTGGQAAPRVAFTSTLTTHLASELTNLLGFDSEFATSAYRTAIENYGRATALRDMAFMHIKHIRGGNGKGAPFDTFCSNGLKYSAGFRWSTGSTNVSYGTGSLLQVSDITSAWDSMLAAQGCLPYDTEMGNEQDNFHGPVGTPANNTQVTDATYSCETSPKPNPCGDFPLWATLVAKQIHTTLAARDSNWSKYGGIKIFGPGLASPHYNTLSLAWHTIYGATVPRDADGHGLDAAQQHSNVWTTPGYPSDAPLGGITAAQINAVYAADPSGFSIYGAPGAIPQVFGEVGQSQMSHYYPSGNAIDIGLSTHNYPRDFIKLFDAGIKQVNIDFLGDKPTTSLNAAFAEEGWIDSRGNLKPGGYSIANLIHTVAYGDGGSRQLSQVVSLPFTVRAGGATGPVATDIAKYAFQKDDGSYWILLVRNAAEGYAFPNAAQSNQTPMPAGATPNPRWRPGTCSPRPEPNDPCFNLPYSGRYLTPATTTAFAPYSITNLPSTISHAAVYQSDEFCDATLTQQSTPFGTPYWEYPQGPNGGTGTDCEQWWPAGSLKSANQASYPAVSAGTVAGLMVNGDILAIHVGSAKLAPVATMTPMPYADVATPAAGDPIPTLGPAPLPTPVPPFGPPKGLVPTPPA